jgi:GTPase SAR1 family protein
MDAKQILPRAPDDVRFRVLIIGRANAGKTSILQRVCDTTESPEIYCVDESGARSRVRFVLWGTFYLTFYLGSTRSFDRG